VQCSFYGVQKLRKIIRLAFDHNHCSMFVYLSMVAIAEKLGV